MIFLIYQLTKVRISIG